MVQAIYNLAGLTPANCLELNDVIYLNECLEVITKIRIDPELVTIGYRDEELQIPATLAVYVYK